MKPDEEENMSAGEKFEHVLAAILLVLVAIIVMIVLNPAKAADPHHDHGNGTDYIVIKKEDNHAKEFAIGIAVTATLVCVYKRFVQNNPCYKSEDRKTTKADEKVAPEVSGVRLYQ